MSLRKTLKSQMFYGDNADAEWPLQAHGIDRVNPVGHNAGMTETKRKNQGAEALSAWLSERGQSAIAFAKSLALPDRYLYRWLDGSVRPRQAARERIAWVTGGKVPPELWDRETCDVKA